MSASFCSKILLVFLVSLLATVLQCMACAEKEVDGVPQESVVVVGGGVVMRTKGGAGVRTTFWSVQGEGPVSFLKGLG